MDSYLQFGIICAFGAFFLWIFAMVMFLINRPIAKLDESIKFNETGMRSYYEYYEEMLIEGDE